MTGKAKAKKSVTFSGSVTESHETSKGTKLQSLDPKFHSWFLVPIHIPFLVIQMYPKLIEDTKHGLIQGLFTLYATQIGYSLLVMSTKTNSKSSTGSSTISGRVKKEKLSDSSIGTKLILLFGSILISILISIPIFIMVILLGAPMYGSILETYLLSLHLLGLFFLPLLLYYKLDISALINSISPGEDKFTSVLFSNQLNFSTVFGIIGTWLGVFPIPLDWDRDWQQWPITLLLGGYIGYTVGSVFSLVINLLQKK